MSGDSTKFVGGSRSPDEQADDVIMMDQATACIVVLNGRRKGAEFPLDDGKTYTIGRDPNASIWVHDNTMSRRHAAVVCAGNVFMLRDLDSTNGTNLEGALLKGTEETLTDGSKFKVGETEFQFVMPGSATQQTVEAGKRPPPRERSGPDLSGTRGELFTSMDELPPEDIDTDAIEPID